MKKSLFLCCFLAAGVTAVAAPRTKAAMQDAARDAINQQRVMRHLAPRHTPMKVLYSTEQVDVLGYDEGGFAVVAADDLMPAVLGVSTARYSHGANPNFQWWLTATAEAAKSIVKSGAPMQVTTPDPTKYPSEVGPLVTSLWDQMTPYNNYCPTSGSSRCVTGCVATAIAQVLNYHKTPEHGIGSHYIYYNGQRVEANFEEDYYDWANMLDVYSEGNYTQEQADAVALLMRDCGVAVDMQYGTASEGGSGAYSQDAASGLRDYFGFEDARCLERDNYSEPEWMDIIYSELSENGPCYYGGASWSSGGHAFVFHGYTAQGMVIVNWGWSGEDDGEYYVSQLNPENYNFNMQQDIIVGVKSDNHALMRNEKVTMTAAGQLQELLEDPENGSLVGTLTVEGPLNAADLAYVRYLAGWDANDEPTEGRLRVLDITKATLEKNTLPDSIFKNCASLRLVRLPETLITIGEKAFAGCTGLTELRVICKSVPTLNGTSVFEGMPFGVARLYVYSGLKTKYVQTAQWNSFGEENIFQVGTSVKVRNAVRYYGEPNPEFVYNVTGDPIEGNPSLSCEASQWSPAGRYPIHVSAGTVVNAEAVNFIDGYIIVRKKDGVVARVQNAERFEGEPNPEFKLTYTGLLSHDAAPEWLDEGVKFTTAANENSPAGDYVVTAQGEAASYDVKFVAGRLTVKPAPVSEGISEVQQAKGAERVYNLQGQRVTPRQKGLYVVDGRKQVR